MERGVGYRVSDDVSTRWHRGGTFRIFSGLVFRVWHLVVLCRHNVGSVVEVCVVHTRVPEVMRWAREQKCKKLVRL